MGSARVFVCVCARVFGGVGDTATSAAAACCHKVAVCSRHRQLLLSAHVHTTPARAPTKCFPFHISKRSSNQHSSNKTIPRVPRNPHPHTDDIIHPFITSLMAMMRTTVVCALVCNQVRFIFSHLSCV